MRLIPVLDLMYGCVVRGVGGRRDEYRPIESRLAAGHDPLVIAAALQRDFGFREFYVADLDAIRDDRPQWTILRRLGDAGHPLVVDAGIRSADRAVELNQCGCNRIVAGQETLAGAAQLCEIITATGAERTVFSLDLQAGRLLGASSGWTSEDPFSRAMEAVRCGARSLIVLDLAGVGVDGGVRTLNLCERIRRETPGVELITGGGVRGRDDLSRLRDAGVDAALVASALHDGRLSPDDLASLSA